MYLKSTRPIAKLRLPDTLPEHRKREDRQECTSAENQAPLLQRLVQRLAFGARARLSPRGHFFTSEMSVVVCGLDKRLISELRHVSSLAALYLTPTPQFSHSSIKAWQLWLPLVQRE